MVSLRIVVLRWLCGLCLLIKVECFHKNPPVSLSTLATCQEYVIESKGCDHYFSVDSLKNYPSDAFKLNVKFYVMATYEVNLVLSDQLNDKMNNSRLEYRAVVGGRLNSVSYLKKMNVENHPQSNNNEQQIVHPLWPTPIVLQQTICGKIVVSIPDVAEPLLQLDAAELNIKYICLFAWDNKSRWFYNCDEEEDNIMDSSTECTQRNPSHYKLDVRAPSQ